MIPFVEKSNTQRQKEQWLLVGEWRGDRQLLFNKLGVLVWDDEKILEMDSGNICKTM